MISGVKYIYNKYVKKPVEVKEKGLAGGDNYNSYRREMNRTFPAYTPKISTQNDEQKLTKLQSMAVAREVVTNDPAMVSALRTTRNSVIGNGWNLSLKPKYDLLGISFQEADDFANRFEDLFNSFANSPDCHFDVSRQMTLNQMIAVFYSSMPVNGDGLAIMQWEKSTNGFYTCANIVDPARLQTPSELINDASLKNGVRIDKFGVPKEYYILNNEYKHSFASGFHNDSSDFMTVKHRTSFNRPIVLHGFDVKFAEQTTGTTDYHSGVMYLKLVSQFLKNENQRMALQASIAMVVKSTEDYKPLMSNVLGKPESPEDMVSKLQELKLKGLNIVAEHTQGLFDALGSDAGSRLVHLLPDEEIQMLTKGDNINTLDGFTKVINKLVSASVGADYATMYQDHADMSYSAARFALSQAQLYFDWLKYVVSVKFAMPLFRCFAEEAIDKGVIKLPRGVTNFALAKDFLLNGVFISSGKPIIDPLKEAKADTEQILNGTMSKDEICAKRGSTYKEVAESRAREVAMEKRLGIFDNSVTRASNTTGDDMAGV